MFILFGIIGMIIGGLIGVWVDVWMLGGFIIGIVLYALYAFFKNSNFSGGHSNDSNMFSFCLIGVILEGVLGGI